MNPSQDPFSRAPISTPDGRVGPRAPMPIMNRDDWRSAPQIVRSVYFLGIFGLAMLALGFVVSLVLSITAPQQDEKVMAVAYLAACAIGLALQVWIISALRKGTPGFWVVQIILSVMGLLSFPLGTVINGYILSQWFNPEVKAWFGRA